MAARRLYIGLVEGVSVGFVAFSPPLGPTPRSRGSMGVCPLLLLLSVALGVSVSAQRPPPTPTGGPVPTAKPKEPSATTLLNVPLTTTTTTTTPLPPPPTTTAPKVAVTTMTTTTTVEGVILTAGPSGATPMPAPPPPPPGPTEAPQVPTGVTPTLQPPPAPTTVSQGGGGENGTTPSVQETQSPDNATNTDTKPTVEATSATSSATVPGGGEEDTDDTPIIAVMVALSSLLVIIFIIIILYMLRFKKYKQAGSHSNSFRLTNGRSDDTELQSVPLLARSPSTNRKYPPLVVDKLEEEMNRAAGVSHPGVMITPGGTKRKTSSLQLKKSTQRQSLCVSQCKCAQYWPDQGCWTYGNIRVGDVGGKKPQRLVTQFHFTSWPDFGVPFTPIGMLKFLKKVKTCNPQYAGPIVVHCSAGVGRTGTFIVIDAMLDMMNTERKVDVFGFVTRIRAQRCQMVQTDMQYVFIFQAMLEHYLYGDTELEVTSLESHLAKLYAPSTAAGCGGMEAEFKGYRQKDSYMASQGPLRHTIEDFWRMIWEWRSCSIVMLTELEERGQEKCAQYWPSDGVMVCGDISIELKKEEESESYTVRDLLVTNNRENKARTVRQFHFHGWPEVGIPSDGKGMINIIAAVQKQQQQSGNHPITVHCSAGAGRTGTFCALSTVLERVKAEAILDVFQTVKSLRLQRPHMVQTLEQYEFCYKVVQEYIDAFSDYANFNSVTETYVVDGFI
ncbi:unnamed protein product [Coregonus sp. 'balchen']|nr:unnamed protein product [Coregonus sp. 'balchen']